MQCCFTIPFLSSHTISLFMALSVSLSLSLSKCLSMHIALSNECLMCAAQLQCSRIFSYLPPSSRAHWAASTSFILACVRLSMPAFKTPLSVFISEASESEGACVHVLSPVCLGCAALWQCHRRGVLVCEPARPQPPSTYHNRGDSHRPYSLSGVLHFYFLPPLLCSTPHSRFTLGISFLGNTTLWEWSGETLSRCLCKNVTLTFKVNFMYIPISLPLCPGFSDLYLYLATRLQERWKATNERKRQRSGAEVKQKWKRVI